MTPAETLLKEIIKTEGPVSFRNFMEIALYHPEVGYYSSRTGQIGEKGDYYTSGSLGPLFGKMLARQIAEMLSGLNAETIVEMGAGNGMLARDILAEFLSKNSQVNYIIVEKSRPLTKLQQETLTGYDVTWYDSVNSLPQLKGVIFSNELLDAFPVHAVEMAEDGLKEVYIGWAEGFTETLNAPSSPSLAGYFENLAVHLPIGFRTEVNLEALTWLDAVASKLESGYLVTIDYGYPSHELYQTYRQNGTLMAYEGHQALENLYTRVGQRDLTAHVNFSALAAWGEKAGLTVAGFTDQAHFLMSLGILETLSDQDTPKAVKTRLNAKSLLLPGGMGEMFKVLIQYKGLEPASLSGLKFRPQRVSCRL
jgi:SAM-dependent MidA family methyltransferase